MRGLRTQQIDDGVREVVRDLMDELMECQDPEARWKWLWLRMQSGGVKWVTALGQSQAEIEAYLGFGALIIDERIGRAKAAGRRAYVVEVGADNAEWLSTRLFSGMRGGQIHDTREAAEAYLDQIASW